MPFSPNVALQSKVALQVSLGLSVSSVPVAFPGILGP